MRRVALSVLLAVLSGSSAFAKDIGVPEICKATIAKVMGRDPRIIRTDTQESGIYYLSYVRDDGTLWSYRCRLEGNQVIWASDKGRWRTHPDDETLTYRLSQDRRSLTISEKFSDGSSTEASFKAADF
ncbi:hypothetical protein [Methylopila sp. Yamaguchi]|uniref:hypothetical protein n=1 Tax=Methylopila sp. Yamaguchi TaxID=1437817 RepID=UPI000CCC9C98|nr:hypothetical protein [Methylopila sp. Yamaguchi]